MSRKIDLSQSLSSEDRAYLEARGRWPDIATADGIRPREVFANVLKHGSSLGPSRVEAIDAEADALGGRQDDVSDEEWVESLTVPQLKKEISDRKPGVDPKGNKSQLQDQLLDILADLEDED